MITCEFRYGEIERILSLGKRARMCVACEKINQCAGQIPIVRTRIRTQVDSVR